jgi:hypothetical protein
LADWFAKLAAAKTEEAETEEAETAAEKAKEVSQAVQIWVNAKKVAAEKVEAFSAAKEAAEKAAEEATKATNEVTQAIGRAFLAGLIAKLDTEEADVEDAASAASVAAYYDAFSRKDCH